jgi:hypothetical protein
MWASIAVAHHGAAALRDHHMSPVAARRIGQLRLEMRERPGRRGPRGRVLQGQERR